MKKLLYVDAFAGISGDMFLAALIDLGFPAESLQALPNLLGFEHTHIELKSVQRKGIAAQQVLIHTPHEHHHRHLHHIIDLLNRCSLPKSVVEGAIHTFQCLGVAEAKIHGIPIEKVHFHEVGAVDSILDIVGTHLGIYTLGIEVVSCSPLPLSRGEGRMAHGEFPLPSPATVEILAGIPTTSSPVNFETVTPTGAALVKTLAADFGSWPQIQIEKSGWGAGTKEGGHLPNLLRLILGRSIPSLGTDSVWVLECEVDDMIPEFLEPLWKEAFALGALDLYFTPVQMKKGRQGILISLLTNEVSRLACERLLLEKTSTFGLRRSQWERTCLDRRYETVHTEYGDITLKISDSFHGKVAPEASTVIAAAEKSNVPMSLVYHSALLAWHKSHQNLTRS